MNVFASSDILISDTSSLLYEYLITGNPIIRVLTDEQDLHTMPSEMNIIGKADVFDATNEDDISAKVNRNLKEQPFREAYKKLLSNCFYYNDGHCTDRAVDFIASLDSN
jgi:CDP-glycerol glycerophosphotransferase (TagB/SpsB family)